MLLSKPCRAFCAWLVSLSAAPALAFSPLASPWQCDSTPPPPPPSGGIYRPTGFGPAGPSALPASTPVPGARAAVLETDWRHWWERNRDEFLRPDARPPVNPATGPRAEAVVSANRELGEGIGTRLRDALLAVIESEDESGALRGAALIALLQARGHAAVDPPRAGKLVEEALHERDLRLFEAGLLALSLSESPDAPIALATYARGADGAHAGRVRALAALGLGLHADATRRVDACRMATHLFQAELAVEGSDDTLAPGATRASFMTALGLAPLPVQGVAMESEGAPSPTGSREGQITWLLDWFEQGPKEGDDARPHAPRSLALLCDGVDEAWRARAVDLLREALGGSSNEMAATRQAAALALGLMGDGDEDAHDVALRASLMKATSDGDAQTRAFACIALAQVAGRPGSGEGERFAAAAPVERHLLGLLARGRDRDRPWVALALGVLGYELARGGEHGSEGVDRALASLVREEHGARELGAYALALGLRSDLSRREHVQECFADSSREELTRSELALAVGLLRGVESRALIAAVMEEPGCGGGLVRESAIALELLGEPRLVERLAGRLTKAPVPDQQAAFVEALGWIGGEAAVDPLLQVLVNARYAESVRLAAAAALGRIASGAPLHWSAPLTRGANYRAEGGANSGL